MAPAGIALLAFVAASAFANPYPPLPYAAEEYDAKEGFAEEQNFPYAEQQRYPITNAEEELFLPKAEEQQTAVKAQNFHFDEATNRYVYVADASDQAAMKAAAVCHNIAVPTIFHGNLQVQICPEKSNGCGHVSVKLGSIVDTKVEICKLRSRPCLDKKRSRNICSRRGWSFISVPVHVRGVRVNIDIGLFPSVSVCVRVYAPVCY